MAKTDWVEIKMFYASDASVSVADVADKYGIPVGTVTWHAQREKWKQAREEYQQNLQKRLADKMLEDEANKTAERLKKINDVADELLEKLSKAVSELGKKVTIVTIKSKSKTKKGEKTTEREKLEIVDTLIDTLKAQQISTSLKSLKELYVGTDDQEDEDAYGVIEIGEKDEEESDLDSAAEASGVYEAQ